MNNHVFERENNNPGMDMVAYVLENYQEKAKVVEKKFTKKINSLYKYQFVGHSAFGFDFYVVLNSLPKTDKNIKK